MISSAGFSPSPTAGGTWSLALGDANSLVLTYTAVPEPTTWVLLAAGVTVVLVARRRQA